jgi:MoaA/NifB/PqqE/SkfB family radical SAM enzyme
MIKTTAINLVKPEPMMVTWDIGKRCNYDCTYCEAAHHNNYSSHASLNELIQTFNFIKSWTALYDQHRNNPVDQININFTGGEPTINPNFWKLVDYITQIDKTVRLSLTTNGSWGPKYTEKISQKIAGVTISYHTEASEQLKKRSIKNIIALSKTNIWLQVNVMMHTDNWDEAVRVCELLKVNNIKHTPRPIGDGNIEKSGWHLDVDGTMRRTSHAYTPEQKEWYFNYLGINQPVNTASEGTQLGRSCCGGRCLTGKVGNDWQEIKLINTEFKGWSCMVDWYFLHIDQDLGTIYHHQTCQALHGGQRGPVGYLKDFEKLLLELQQRLVDPSPIICPNQRCGCGMCVPKAKLQEDFAVLWANK